jgi:hypothetical protein
MRSSIGLRAALVTATVVVLATGAFAERFEVSPYAGGFFPVNYADPGVSLKSEGLYGARGGFFLTRKLEAEGNLGYMNHFEFRNAGHTKTRAGYGTLMRLTISILQNWANLRRMRPEELEESPPIRSMAGKPCCQSEQRIHAIFDAILAPDGQGSVGYAAGQIFMAHTDGGGTQLNFSEISGNSTAVAISTAYYQGCR